MKTLFSILAVSLLLASPSFADNHEGHTSDEMMEEGHTPKAAKTPAAAKMKAKKARAKAAPATKAPAEDEMDHEAQH